MSRAAMVKAKKTVALEVTTSLIGEDMAIFNLTVMGKCHVKTIGDGFPAKIMNKELLSGRVEISETVNLSECSQVGVKGDGIS